LSSSAGILSQQFILALPIVYAWDVIIKRFKKNEKSIFRRQLLFFIPLIIPASLFWNWGGLLHENFSFHSASFQITNLTSVLTIVGGATFFYFLSMINDLDKKFFTLFLILSTILVLFFNPVRMEYGGAGQITGYTFHFLEKVDSISKILSKIIQIILCTSGIYIFFHLKKLVNDDFQEILYFLTIAFAVIYFFDTVLSERHLLPLITIIFLMILPQLKNKLIVCVWIIFQVLFGSIFLWYALFI
jgi:hypothetical protein